MSDKEKQSQPQEQEPLHTMHINGKCPTQKVAQRILTAPAPPADKDDPSTSPLYSAVRGFNLMR